MSSQAAMHFPMPFNYSMSSKILPRLLYLVQVSQAMCIKMETEFYRRKMDVLLSNGEGLTMGTLYWQLNGIWPGAGWESIGK